MNTCTHECPFQFRQLACWLQRLINAFWRGWLILTNATTRCMHLPIYRTICPQMSTMLCRWSKPPIFQKFTLQVSKQVVSTSPTVFLCLPNQSPKQPPNQQTKKLHNTFLYIQVSKQNVEHVGRVFLRKPHQLGDCRLGGQTSASLHSFTDHVLGGVRSRQWTRLKTDVFWVSNYFVEMLAFVVGEQKDYFQHMGKWLPSGTSCPFCGWKHVKTSSSFLN